jgi:uncharacterized protein YdhG (YjbR/CyaY superfamily)
MGVEVAMKSSATTVAGYISDQPTEWQPTLRKLRAACRGGLQGYEEAMRYGMPSYVRDGQVEVSFAKQEHHLSLYILKQSVFDAHRAALVGLSLGKGCVRYRRPEQIDWSTVESLLAGSRDSTREIC